MNMLAFDLGGSGAKLVLGKFDGHTLRLETIHRFEHSPIRIRNGLYWDIVNIYRNLMQGIGKAVEATGDSIESFGVDSFSNDFAFVSREGELLSQLRCYRDSRTERYKERIYAKMPPEKLYALTGNQNANFNTLMQLAAMCEAGQGYLIRNACKMLFTPDLLTYFLTGNPVAEYTVSSVSQMFSFAANRWDPEILKTFGLSESLFGKLVMPGTVVGVTDGSVNRFLGAKGFPVVAVCEHDTASAFLASAGGKDSVIISSGTWALVGVQVEKPMISGYGLKYNVANEGGYRGYHRLLRNVMGTWIIQQIREDCRRKGREYTYSQLEAMAAESEPFAYWVDVDDPVFFEPGNMPEKVRQACKKLWGSAPRDLGGVVRCVYESLAMKFRWSVEILEHMTGRTYPSVNLIGGGSKDGLMCQLTADICGKPVTAGPAEATSYGNLMVQLIADGAVENVEEGRKILRASFSVREYRPQMPADGEYRKFKSMLHLA
jgi:sugar (pentulose or hexulose) kinase